MRYATFADRVTNMGVAQTNIFVYDDGTGVNLKATEEIMDDINIRKAYMMEEGILFALTAGMLMIFDVILQLVLHLADNYTLKTLFTLPVSIILWMLLTVWKFMIIMLPFKKYVMI